MKESYFGYLNDSKDVRILIRAAQLGLIPMIKNKVHIKDLKKIRSGSIYLWNETENHLKRWRDGRRWSASRFQGKFLVYRELFKVDYQLIQGDFNKNTSLYKKTISMKCKKGNKFRLVNYYHPNDLIFNKLVLPKDDHRFNSLITKGDLDHFIVSEQSYKSQTSPQLNSQENASLYSINFIMNNNESSDTNKKSTNSNPKDEVTSLPPISSFPFDYPKTSSASISPKNSLINLRLPRDREDIRQLNMLKINLC